MARRYVVACQYRPVAAGCTCISGPGEPSGAEETRDEPRRGRERREVQEEKSKRSPREATTAQERLRGPRDSKRAEESQGEPLSTVRMAMFCCAGGRFWSGTVVGVQLVLW